MVRITLEFPDNYYAKLWWDWYLEGSAEGEFAAEAAKDLFSDGDSLDFDTNTVQKVIKYEEVKS